MVQKGRKGKGKQREDDVVVDDPRFAAMHTAPLFKKQQKDSHKFVVDKRFEAVLTDERFQAPQPKYDKYGRKTKKPAKSELGEMYKLEQSAEERLEYLNRLARGEIEESGSDSDVSSDGEARVKARKAVEGEEEGGSDVEDAEAPSEEEEDSDDYDSITSEDERNTISLLEISKAPVEYGDATNRLAVMNCDWQHMKAADVFALLQSFCPTGSTVKKVVVYVSDFGAERLEKEATLGPQAIWAEEDEKAGVSKDNTDSDDENAGGEIDEVRLRKYEIEKLSYYFAIADCDNISTANALYDQLNGIEVSYSSVQLDLRFVPDDVDFAGRKVRDQATTIPDDYEPPEFVSQALQSSKVRCTWDEPELERSKKLTNFTKWRDLKESDFQVYLASESEDESETEVQKAANLRKLLLADDEDGEGGDGGEGRDSFFLNDGSDDEDEGANSDDERIADFEKGWAAADQEADDEVVHEFTYVPKSKPTKADGKKKSKKGKKGKQQSEEDEEEAQQPHRPEKDDTEEAAARAMDNDDEEEPTGKGKKSKRKKSKKKRKMEEAEEETAGFALDVHDPRFAAVVEGDERFGIDRTDKHFKESEGMRALLVEQRKRKLQKLEKQQRLPGQK